MSHDQIKTPGNHVPFLPPPVKDFKDPKQQYMEQYGTIFVTNNHLRIAVLCLSLVTLAALALNFRIMAALRSFKPLVIRIDDVGRAQAVDYASMVYRPQAPEIRYFLTRFVHDHYSRNRQTLRDDFARSLFFLDSRLASACMDENRKTKAIETYIVNANEDIEASVKNIVLQDLRTPPFRAAVDFEKIFLSSSDRSELRREKYIASIEFTFRDTVPNDMIPVNPLGLTITYYREDQAFKEVKP